MIPEPLPVFIGYDQREHEAYNVCRYSLMRHSNIPLHVQSLNQKNLRWNKLYWREFSTTESGQKIDARDGKPFSTEFSFTRFLVPALCQYEGWAMFVDCDFLFVADVGELVSLLDPAKAVMVCQQTHEPKEAEKMDGQEQTRYQRKNWSSFMLFNCGHASVRNLTVDAVNNEPGSWLHQFQWLRDEEIGALPPQWNWIENVTEGEPKAIHYTLGGPWFEHYKNVAFADKWEREAKLYKHHAQTRAGSPLIPSLKVAN